jgi:hypothetical protein
MCFVDSSVVNEILVFQINFWWKILSFCVAPKRYGQFYENTTNTKTTSKRATKDKFDGS